MKLRRQRLNLCLSGGGVLGALQAGQLHALAERGIEFDSVSGCSVGALHAVMVAAGLSPERLGEIDDVWLNMTDDALFPGTSFGRVAALVRRQQALHPPTGLWAVINRMCPVDRLEDLPIPCEIVTCNLSTGEAEYHTSGPAREILAASCALPGLFPPVKIDGEFHVDGGVVDVLPWRRALERNDLVMVSDCRAGTPWEEPRLKGALSVVLASFQAARMHQTRAVESPRVLVLDAPDARGTKGFADALALREPALEMARVSLDAREEFWKKHVERGRRHRRGEAAVTLDTPDRELIVT